MKNYILLLLFALIFSCKEKKANNTTSSNLFIIEKSEEDDVKKNECIEAEKSFLWKTNIDNKGNDYLIKGNKIIEIKNDLKLISTHLNRLNAPLEVRILKIKDSILKINFKNEEILTQKMGTTGASQFVASLVYSFTENDKISEIEIEIKEGDHFSPGVYSRNDFKNDFYIYKCE